MPISSWARTQFPGAPGIVLMIVLPLLAAAAWGTFNVKDDTSRSGKAPVPVPGWVRLLLEFTLFGSEIWALYPLQPTLGWILGAVTLAHSIFSYNRTVWLLSP